MLNIIILISMTCHDLNIACVYIVSVSNLNSSIKTVKIKIYCKRLKSYTAKLMYAQEAQKHLELSPKYICTQTQVVSWLAEPRTSPSINHALGLSDFIIRTATMTRFYNFSFGQFSWLIGLRYFIALNHFFS